MKLVKECWLALLEAFNALTGTPTDGSQQSLGLGLPGWRPGRGHRPHVPHYPLPPKKNPLVFPPPSQGEWRGDTIECDYKAMGDGWRPCSTPEDRGCWLQGPPGTEPFTIDTDYENYAPKGVTRKVFVSYSRYLHRHDD